MKKIIFLFGVHNHQPVGNFGNVFEQAYQKSYEPFLSVLERFPKVKISLHCSGPLWDWILSNRKEYVKRIQNLVDR